MKTIQLTGQQAWEELQKGTVVYIDNLSYFMSYGTLYYQNEEKLTIESALDRIDIIKLKGWFMNVLNEYNLTINQVMRTENIGKYFKDEWDDAITKLMTNDEGDMELVIVKCEKYADREYSLIEDFYTLGKLLNTNFKEVDYNC